MGHLKNYSVGDAVAHFRRRNGMRVLHPMGYDAFGLPAENNAIKTGVHPREATEKSIASFQQQFRSWGISIDWSREFGTHEPRYYRWTQWIFLKLFERGLAYRKEAAVNWCPKDATVLANEQVIDGHCERCGTAVELRQLEQWFFRITDYADRLLDDLDDDRLAAPRGHDAAQLDRPLRGRRGDVHRARLRPRLPRLHHPPGHAVRRDLLRDGARAPRRAAPGGRHRARARGARLRQHGADREQGRARRHRPHEDRRPAGPQRHQPGQRRADPDVRRRLRADGVRHRRDHGRPRPRRARLRLRHRVRPADPPRRRRRRGAAVPRRRSAGQLRPGVRRPAQPRGAGEDRRLARPRGQGPPLDQLPPARLAAVPPALLGLPDPDRLLRHARHGPGAGGRPAGDPARRRGLRAAGQVAAGRGRGLGQHRVPDLRRPRAARDGHDGHLRRLVLVLPALHATPTTTRRRGTRRSSTAGCRSTSTSAASSTRSCT